MNLDKQITFNYFSKSVGLALGLLFAYLLRVDTDDNTQSEYFKSLVFTTVGSSFISLPIGFILASMKCSLAEAKYLIWLQVLIAGVTTCLLGFLFSLFNVGHAFVLAVLIGIQAFNSQITEFFLYFKLRRTYSLTAFVLGPLASVIALFLTQEPLGILIVALTMHLLISLAVYQCYQNKVKRKRLIFHQKRNVLSVYGTDVLNSLKTNLDKIAVINFGSVEFQSIFFLIERFFRLIQTLFNVNSSYLFIKWSAMSTKEHIISDFKSIRKSANLIIWLTIIAIVFSRSYFYEATKIPTQQGDLVVLILIISLLIKLLSGYTFVLIKVINPSILFKLNFLHFCLMNIIFLLIGYALEKELVIPAFIIINSIILSVTHWLALRNIEHYTHYSLGSLLSIAAIITYFHQCF